MNSGITAKILVIIFLSAMGSSKLCAEERELSVINKVHDIALSGTLSVPENQPFAALVMATGSGAQTRDEEIFGHKIFKDIADYCAARGIASLRLDDRGTGKSGGIFKNSTTDDFVEDIRAGLAALDSIYPQIPVGVLGHSEGGTIAIKLAQDDKCDFIITLAAPAWSGDSIIMSQTRAAAMAQTGTWAKEEVQRKLLDYAKSEYPEILAGAMMKDVLSTDLGDAANLPRVKAQVDASVEVMLSPWYRSMLRYNPADDIRAVAKPWLALNGTKDTQVLPENLSTIYDINYNAELYLLPDHNHLFQHATTGLFNEYAMIAESISDETLSTIVAWLEKNFKRYE